VPSYVSYSRKSHRTEAKTALLDIAALEERYYSVNNTYSANPADVGYTAWPAVVGSGYYQINAPVIVAATPPNAGNPAGTPATYTFTAQPIGDQVNDAECTSFTINSQNQQLATPAANTFTCWH